MRSAARRMRLTSIMGMAGGCALLAGCVGMQSAIHSRGVAASRIETLWWVSLALGGGVWLVVTVLLLGAVRRRRLHGEGLLRRVPRAVIAGRERAAHDDDRDERSGKDAGDGAEREEGDAGEEAIEHEAAERRGVRWIAIGGVAIPAVILAVMFVYTIGTLRALSLDREPAALEVEVVARQWWWEVRYLDPLPVNVITSANELHVPVGQRVRLRLRASDVIHSFWVPQLGGKLDLVPGRENVTWIQADTAGVFRGQCAEFCGVQHAHMAFFVVAHPPGDFAAWLERERRPAPVPAPTDTLARRGLAAFEAHGCALCHNVRGTLASASVGPDLTHVASRLSLAAGTLPNVRGHLAGWIADPQSAKPGNRMPRVPLTPDELHAIVAYLQTLR